VICDRHAIQLEQSTGRASVYTRAPCSSFLTGVAPPRSSPMLGELCQRGRSRSPRCDDPGANRPPVIALPVRLKTSHPLVGYPAPSAPHPFPGGFWQRSPGSGLLRAWLLPTSPPGKAFFPRIGEHTAAAIRQRFGQRSPKSELLLAEAAGEPGCPAFLDAYAEDLSS
jgi:hypothetical protein